MTMENGYLKKCMQAFMDRGTIEAIKDLNHVMENVEDEVFWPETS